MFNKILDLIFPKQCCNCHMVGEYVCHDCYEQVEFFTAPIQLRLDNCQLDQLWAVAHLQPPLSKVIHALKYHSVKGIGRWLGEFLYFTTAIPECDLVTAVPLHPRRQYQRGFNQAAEIATTLAEKISRPYHDLLIRPHYSQSQASLTKRSDRLTHLQAAFALASMAEPLVKGQRVLLIDDVATTGTTLNECAAVLKAAGAAQVIGLTVCHGG